MRVAAFLLLAGVSISPSMAGHKARVWVSGTVRSAKSDDWCRTPQLSIVGVDCRSWLDPSEPEPWIGLPPGFSPAETGARFNRAVREVIRIDGPESSYLVKYEAVNGRLKLRLQTPVDFAVEGKHLFLRQSGMQYRTNILQVKPLKP